MSFERDRPTTLKWCMTDTMLCFTLTTLRFQGGGVKHSILNMFWYALLSLRFRVKHTKHVLVVTAMHTKQECIPVGCILADRWLYSGVCCFWGGVPARGVPGLGGVPAWSRGGVYLPGPRGVPTWSQGVYLPGPGRCTWSGGVSAWSQGGVPGLGGTCLARGECTCLVLGGCLVRYSPC